MAREGKQIIDYSLVLAIAADVQHYKRMVDSQNAFDLSVESIKKLYREYSAEEIASALFVSNLWLPNIASPADLPPENYTIG